MWSEKKITTLHRMIARKTRKNNSKGLVAFPPPWDSHAGTDWIFLQALARMNSNTANDSVRTCAASNE